MAKILVIEDEPDIAKVVSDCLTKDNHLVEVEYDGLDAWIALNAVKFDVIVLDLRLPGVDGLELCRRFRRDGGNTPVLILTARDSAEDKESGFAAGADDYLTKPFQHKELSARIKALLRRGACQPSNIIHIGDIEIDLDGFRVLKGGEPVHLQRKEFRLLEFLARHPNRIFSAEELLDSVWERGTDAKVDTVRGHIKRLRKKLDSDGVTSIISTVYGLGYKIEIR